MPVEAYGLITVPTPGTPVRVTQAAADPTANVKCHGYMFQQWPGQTGKIYIGKLGMNKTTGANVLAVLPIPTTNTLPSFSCALTWSPNGLNLQELFIDADNPDEGAVLSVLVG